MKRAEWGTKGRALVAGIFVTALASMAVFVASARGAGQVAPSAVITAEETPTGSTSIVLDPVPTDYEAAIDSDLAVALALEASPVDGSAATSVKPTLAVVTNTQSHDVNTGELTVDHVPAWVVTLDGVCVPVYGAGSINGSDGYSSTEDCAGTQVNVIIDATTGEFIEAFSDT